jgi:hypothetical protein
VTASGGDTTAPSTSATASVMPGITAAATAPAIPVVTATRNTPKLRIEPSRRMKLTNENCRAAENNKGGSTTVRMISGSSSSRPRRGMNEASSPTNASNRGGWMFRRSATIVTAIAAIITIRICATNAPPSGPASGTI